MPQLVCPAVTNDELSDRPNSISRIAFEALAARYCAPESTFGLELKVAYFLEINEDPASVAERLRRPFYRLAQEPIIWSWWSALQQSPLAAEDMLALVSVLNGEPVRYRRKEMFSTGSRGTPGLRYETPECAQSWRHDISIVEQRGGDPIKQALYRFARIVAAHPFSSANGRFARAALQGGLARGGLIATPCLALAPVFYLRAAEIRAALWDLGAGGDWRLYFERMGNVLAAALNHVDAADKPIN